MRRNRFEQVDEPQPDAITLELGAGDDPDTGRVHVPAACSGGRLEADAVSDDLPKIDAFRSAVRLGNELTAAVVVMDPDSHWMDEWGDLYRPA